MMMNQNILIGSICVIYRIYNKLTGKSYIGRTDNIVRRIRHHWNSKNHKEKLFVNIRMWIEGIENFEYEVLHTFQYSTMFEVNLIESLYIIKYQSLWSSGNGYNFELYNNHNTNENNLQGSSRRGTITKFLLPIDEENCEEWGIFDNTMLAEIGIKTEYPDAIISAGMIRSCNNGNGTYAGFCSDLMLPIVSFKLESKLSRTQKIEKYQNAVKFFLTNIDSRPKEVIALYLKEGQLCEDRFESRRSAALAVGLSASALKKCLDRSKTQISSEHNQKGDISADLILWLYTDRYDKLTYEEIIERIKSGQNRINNEIIVVSFCPVLKVIEYSSCAKFTEAVNIVINNRFDDYKFVMKNGNTPFLIFHKAFYEDCSPEEQSQIINEFRKENTIICLNHDKIFWTRKQAMEWANIKDYKSLLTHLKGKITHAGNSPINKESLIWMTGDDYFEMNEAEREDYFLKALKKARETYNKEYLVDHDQIIYRTRKEYKNRYPGRSVKRDLKKGRLQYLSNWIKTQ